MRRRLTTTLAAAIAAVASPQRGCLLIVLNYTGSLSYIVDENDWVISDSTLKSSLVHIRIVADRNTGKYVSATLEITANS